MDLSFLVTFTPQGTLSDYKILACTIFLIPSFLPRSINHGKRKNLTSWEFTISTSSLSLKCLYYSKVTLKFKQCF